MSSEPTQNVHEPVTRRVFELDLLRLIAALMVLAYHYTYTFRANDGYGTVVFPADLEAVTRYGFLGVQLFFFISGAVILRSAIGRTGSAFVSARFSRLFPAYWAMVTITYLARLFFGSGPEPALSFVSYLGNLTMLQSFYGGSLVDGVYWTLARELVFYGIIWMALASGQVRHLWAVLAVWLASSVALEIFHPAGTVARLLLASDYAPFFVGGASCALLARSNTAQEQFRNRVLAGASLVSAVWLTQGREATRINATFGSGTVSSVLMGVIAVGFFLVVWATCADRLKELGRPWMAVAGGLTYPLYLVHQTVGALLFTRLGGNRWVLLCAITFAMVVLSWLVQTLVERPLAPVLRHASGRVLALSPRGPSRPPAQDLAERSVG